jgi:hypothetical protein
MDNPEKLAKTNKTITGDNLSRRITRGDNLSRK